MLLLIRVLADEDEEQYFYHEYTNEVALCSQVDDTA
jgi:hypothetical protein